MRIEQLYTLFLVNSGALIFSILGMGASLVAMPFYYLHYFCLAICFSLIQAIVLRKILEVLK